MTENTNPERIEVEQRREDQLAQAYNYFSAPDSNAVIAAEEFIDDNPDFTARFTLARFADEITQAIEHDAGAETLLSVIDPEGNMGRAQRDAVLVRAFNHASDHRTITYARTPSGLTVVTIEPKERQLAFI